MNFGVVGTGKMGKEIIETFQDAGHKLVLKVNSSGQKMEGVPDVIVDFSRPEALKTTLSICYDHKIPLVIGTTGLGQEEMEELKKASNHFPVVQSYNFSIGINLMLKILSQFSIYLNGWDTEIFEMHHSSKKDKPSGTALMIKNALGREVPIHSLRIGGVYGDHRLIFGNTGEIIEISHRALSRKVFAMGALKSAEWIVGKAPRFYAFDEIIENMKGVEK
ncbi:4-hydroxy-tetrahydrodipicolinate reductase [Athalassotoga saccharophila]|uniref:4-hydroxy-tetrahydrodipicolinate reductase n=1 Tax=Athalassotoga saccharophila TaxID=1441386 RepID=UPI00137B2898|nr:dihydrodipicolinate reductase C-terminal domain-containing protein [Athalassotoga saccharophila]BBJ28616.1 4-hydroxy-tetrahydrodipicolinate reductase [Athalassotoga saccharophila]